MDMMDYNPFDCQHSFFLIDYVFGGIAWDIRYEQSDKNDGYEVYDARLWEGQGELNNSNDSESDFATSDNGSFSTFQSIGEDVHSSCGSSEFTQTFDVVSQASSSVNTDGGWEFIEDENDNDVMSLDSDVSVVSTTVIESIGEEEDSVTSKKSWADIVAAPAVAKATPSPLLQAHPIPSSVPIAAASLDAPDNDITPTKQQKTPEVDEDEWMFGNLCSCWVCRGYNSPPYHHTYPDVCGCSEYGKEPPKEDFSYDAAFYATKSQYGGKSLIHQLKGNPKRSKRGGGKCRCSYCFNNNKQSARREARKETAKMTKTL